MAIIPAPMDQCAKKSRCQNGPNQGLAYDAKNPCVAGQQFVRDICDCCPEGTPCSNGISGTLTSSLTSRSGHLEVTTFYPSVAGGAAQGCTRSSEDLIEVFNGTEFVSIGAPPYAVGDDYLGEKITSVVHVFTLAGNCEPVPKTFGCAKKAGGTSNSIVFECSLPESDPEYLTYCSIRVGGYAEITEVREYANVSCPSDTRFEIDAIKANGLSETISTTAGGSVLTLNAGTSFSLHGQGDCLP